MTAVADTSISTQENLQLRGQHIPESCELHFNNDPMRIVRSKDQYLFDEYGNRYLDFVTRITNVGHCNSEVLQAACHQMAQLSMAVGDQVERLQQQLAQLLLSTLPPNFDTVLFTNSGAEANDLALQMARNYTNRHDLVVVDGAFHGTGNLLVDISPRAFKATSEGKKPWVHVIPVPDMYRGPYSSEPDAGERFYQDARTVMDRVIANNHKIAGLICEPVMVVHGLVIPPPGWLRNIYNYIHDVGGVVVADEIQCGMGRTGEKFWAFQGQNAVPDIITVGKPLGNGHPIGAVITCRKIAATIKNAEQIYKCDPVGATISMTVLNLMKEKHLMNNACKMGAFLAQGFKNMQTNHSVIGDVRFLGLIVAVDIVRSKGSKKPAPEIAEELCNLLRKEKILVGCEGDYKNVMLFLPALCITEQDCLEVIKVMGYIVRSVELTFLDDLYDIILNSPSPGPSTSTGFNPLHEGGGSSSSPERQETLHPYDALD